MTRPTGDVGLPVIELRVNVSHHPEHHKSLRLFGLGIERQVVQLVAVYAADSERESNVLHREFDVLRRQHFEIGGTNDCRPSRREWRRRALAAAFTTTLTAALATTPTGSDSESACSLRQILGHQRNLRIRQIRTLPLHASDCGGPSAFVPRLVVHAIERMARGADRVHEVCSNCIGTGGRLGSRSTAFGCLSQNDKCNEREKCGHIHDEFLHGRIICNWQPKESGVKTFF